uniref:Uncharacterized protein n=1 Tax=Macrostomum lignano TaxID=282301 RepID=A0A1I8FYU5_9PLAT
MMSIMGPLSCPVEWTADVRVGYDAFRSDWVKPSAKMAIAAFYKMSLRPWLGSSLLLLKGEAGHSHPGDRAHLELVDDASAWPPAADCQAQSSRAKSAACTEASPCLRI